MIRTFHYRIISSPLNDLREACFHEAGHTLAARHLGHHAELGVRPTYKYAPPKKRAFAGTTVWYSDDAFHNGMIAWAGPLAEWKNNRHFGKPEDYLSRRDKKLVNASGKPEQAMSEARTLVEQLWEEIKRTALEEEKRLANKHRRYLKNLGVTW